MERAEFMTDTAATHQGTIKKCFGFTFKDVCGTLGYNKLILLKKKWNKMIYYYKVTMRGFSSEKFEFMFKFAFPRLPAANSSSVTRATSRTACTKSARWSGSSASSAIPLKTLMMPIPARSSSLKTRLTANQVSDTTCWFLWFLYEIWQFWEYLQRTICRINHDCKDVSGMHYCADTTRGCKNKLSCKSMPWKVHACFVFICM